MTADGFLNQKYRHPFAMTAAVAINATAVAALMLAKAGYVVVPPGAIPTINIFDAPPPPPEPAEPPEPQARHPDTPVHIPPRQVSTEATIGGPAIGGTPVLPLAGGTDSGNGTGPIPQPMPTTTPMPVLTEAAPLPGAIRDFQPPYPPQLLRTGIEGKAVIRVLIGADGRVKQAEVVSADDTLFAEVSERHALRKWRFRPATRDGIAVESWKTMTVRFEIKS